MASFVYDRPLPGQSLTTSPRNAPYERPPEIVDPEDALMVHLTRLNKPEAMKSVISFVEAGIDLQTLVEGITRNAVMNGVHTIDVSLIVAPVIHEFIRNTLDMVGVEYDEGFDEDEDTKRLQMYTKAKARAARELMDMDKEKGPIDVQYDELIAAMSKGVAPEGFGEGNAMVQAEQAEAPTPRRRQTQANPDQMELPLEEPTQQEPEQTQAEPEPKAGLMSRRA